MQQGILQGIELGESRVLERLLSKRFGSLPEEYSQRLKNATTEQLERWAERILDASTLSEVFAEH
jgi:hypothetical protein